MVWDSWVLSMRAWTFSTFGVLIPTSGSWLHGLSAYLWERWLWQHCLFAVLFGKWRIISSGVCLFFFYLILGQRRPMWPATEEDMQWTSGASEK